MQVLQESSLSVLLDLLSPFLDEPTGLLQGEAGPQVPVEGKAVGKFFPEGRASG